MRSTLTVNQQTNYDGFPKAAELIEIKTHQDRPSSTNYSKSLMTVVA